MSYKLDGCSKWISSHFQDEGETTRAKEITLEAMSFAASEVDGSGTVDRSSSAAERLKQNTNETSRTVQDGGDDKQVFLTDSLKALWFKMSASLKVTIQSPSFRHSCLMSSSCDSFRSALMKIVDRNVGA